jgi:arginyl-tRNA synthetase
LAATGQYGRCDLGQGRKIQVEFVSANPTGPLHVGHGRGAAYGASLANLLAAVGFEVQREYYVNDAGRQMDILATSIWLRYLELAGTPAPFPRRGYQGDYVWDIAASLHRAHAGRFCPAPEVFAALGNDGPDDTALEQYVDALISLAQQTLGADYQVVFAAGLDTLLGDTADDLAHFGVTFDGWYSERGLHERGVVAAMLTQLAQSGHVYEQGGALWFRATAYGDEKDRVVRRENGQTTYFAADIAYHWEKFQRGFSEVIDIWGADHHGYIPRVQAALQALGLDPARLRVLLVQFVTLIRDGKPQAMSTRSGEFVTLRQLRREVGNDAARFFYILRKSEQHLDFDLDLAKAQSNDNPVYYIQYAHARICSVQRQAIEKERTEDPELAQESVAQLTSSYEQTVLQSLARYPEIIELAAQDYAPHHLAYYLRTLADAFHAYYNAEQFLVEDVALRSARLYLIRAVQRVLVDGLSLLGVSAPERM